MSLRGIRWFLGIALAALSLAALRFGDRQNAGLNVGGAISPQKLLWLWYAIASWFVVPCALAFDSRLARPVRRLHGIFWGWMLARGVVELFLLYRVGHWNPWYGISHDLSCIVLLLVLGRRARSGPEVQRADPLQRRSLAFSGSMLVGLTAEVAFAGMFLQTGSHENAIYFASAGVSWGYINLATTLVLVFVLPDLAAFLAAYVFPGFRREAPVLLRRLRVAAAVVTGGLALAALAFWTRMMRLEDQAKRFQETGYQIVDSLTRFRVDFQASRRDGMADFIRGGELAWHPSRPAHTEDFELERWEPSGTPAPLLDALLGLRASFEVVDQAAFKIHLLDEANPPYAVAQVRHEITGALAGGRGRGADAGLLRMAFERGDDGRWRATGASLLDRVVTWGRADQFQDRAAERGLRFRMDPDPRFVPCGSCTAHACDGPTRLKFQTMRHAYAGCAAADYDGDGSDDVFLCGGARSALFRNRGDGSFEDTTMSSGLGEIWHINTAGFADADNDGDQDLFLGAFYGQNRLFEGASGKLSDRTQTSGLGRDDCVTCFSWFDADSDGDLDLYLGRFLDAATAIPDSFLYARNGEPNLLYRNDGGLHFTDVTGAAGVGDRGLTLAVAAADHDLDGDQDLYVANDFGRNVLYVNRGDGTFRDAAREAGALAIGGSMSASWGDYDNDGRLDLYVAAIRSNQRWFVQPITARRVVYKFIREGKLGPDNPIFSDLKAYMGDNWVNVGNVALAGNSLLHQEPGGSFVDLAESAGARPAGWYWGSSFLDFDQDGDLDLLATNGWITGANPHDL